MKFFYINWRNFLFFFILYVAYVYFMLYYLFTVKHIKSIEGLTGCYRGLVPKVCSYTVSTIACDKTLEYLQLNSVQNEDEDDENEIVR